MFLELWRRKLGSLIGPWDLREKVLGERPNSIRKSEAGGACLCFHCSSCQNLKMGRFCVQIHISSLCNTITRLGCYMWSLHRLVIICWGWEWASQTGDVLHLPKPSPLSNIALGRHHPFVLLPRRWRHYVCHLPTIVPQAGLGFTSSSLWLSLCYMSSEQFCSASQNSPGLIYENNE